MYRSFRADFPAYRDLNPKPLCYMMLGAIMCGRSLENTERLLDVPISNAPHDSDLVVKDIEVFNAWGGVNNYAMNCFDSSFATKICLDNFDQIIDIGVTSVDVYFCEVCPHSEW